MFLFVVTFLPNRIELVEEKDHGTTPSKVKHFSPFAAVSPRYDEMTASKRTRARGRYKAVAIASAVTVFPQPGGPQNSTRRAGRSPREWSNSARLFSSITRPICSEASRASTSSSSERRGSMRSIKSVSRSLSRGRSPDLAPKKRENVVGAPKATLRASENPLEFAREHNVLLALLFGDHVPNCRDERRIIALRVGHDHPPDKARPWLRLRDPVPASITSSLLVQPSRTTISIARCRRDRRERY